MQEHRFDVGDTVKVVSFYNTINSRFGGSAGIAKREIDKVFVISRVIGTDGLRLKDDTIGYTWHYKDLFKVPVVNISTMSFQNIHRASKNDPWAAMQFFFMCRHREFFNYDFFSVLPKKKVMTYLRWKSRWREWLDCNGFDVTYEDKTVACVDCGEEYTIDGWIECIDNKDIEPFRCTNCDIANENRNEHSSTCKSCVHYSISIFNYPCKDCGFTGAGPKPYFMSKNYK